MLNYNAHLSPLKTLQFNPSVPAHFQSFTIQFIRVLQSSGNFKEIYDKALANGPITVEFLPASQLDSFAQWNCGKRSIQIRANAIISEQWHSLIFELCNAANPGWDNVIAPSGFSTADDYADHKEKIEFHTVKKVHAILNDIKYNFSLMQSLRVLGVTEEDVSIAIENTPSLDFVSYMKATNDRSLLGYSHRDIYRKAFDHHKKTSELREVLKTKLNNMTRCYELIFQEGLGSSNSDLLNKNYKNALQELQQVRANLEFYATEYDFLACYKVKTTSPQPSVAPSLKETPTNSVQSFIDDIIASSNYAREAENRRVAAQCQQLRSRTSLVPKLPVCSSEPLNLLYQDLLDKSDLEQQRAEKHMAQLNQKLRASMNKLAPAPNPSAGEDMLAAIARAAEAEKERNTQQTQQMRSRLRSLGL